MTGLGAIDTFSFFHFINIYLRVGRILACDLDLFELLYECFGTSKKG